MHARTRAQAQSHMYICKSSQKHIMYMQMYTPLNAHVYTYSQVRLSTHIAVASTQALVDEGEPSKLLKGGYIVDYIGDYSGG